MAKNIREADGFNNMFASLGGFGNNTTKKNDTKKPAAKSPLDKEKKAEEKKEHVKVVEKDTEKKAEKESTTKSEVEKKAKLEPKSTTKKAVITEEKPTKKEELEAEEAKSEETVAAEEVPETKEVEVSVEPEAEEAVGVKKPVAKKKTNTSKTAKKTSIMDENEPTENTSVRLYARNKKYFEIRSAQLGVSQMEYINFLLEEEAKREEGLDLDPFTIELPKKESTSIKALVLASHNMDFLRDASAKLGMKMTQFINWMLDNERERERTNGPRKKIK